MVDDKRQETQLDALFSDIRTTPPQMPEQLEQRMLADALAHMPVAPALDRSQARPSGSLLNRMAEAMGGTLALGGALGGLVSACVTGFWLGVSPPSGLVDSAAFAVLAPSAEAETMFESFDLAVVLGEELQ